ncbi:MAG: peptide deformylase [Alphaproteobacteria bacterium]|jgi:peptide deformylase
MSRLAIIIAPDPRLKIKAKPVAAVDDAVRRLMDDMLETMYGAPGIGMAATQVGEAVRVIVVDVSPLEGDPEPMQMANPEVIWASDEREMCEEGCLSLPSYYAEVERPVRVRVRYLDYDNVAREIDAEGALATCIQHEIDHLDGTLFVDHISALKRGIILRKLKKQKKIDAEDAARGK